jgi:hypothetical protein
VVLGQAGVRAKTNEIPMSATPLDRIDLAGAVVTADAMHVQRAHADCLAGYRRAHHRITVGRNQPSQHAQLVVLLWRRCRPPTASMTRAHGRAGRWP